MELVETTKQQQAQLKNEPLFNMSTYPKTYTGHDHFKSLTVLQQSLTKNFNLILTDLMQNGSILFRDFDIKSPNEAVVIMKQLGFVDFDHSCAKNHTLIVGSKDKNLLNTEPLSMFVSQTNAKIDHLNVHNQFCDFEKKSPEYVAFYCLRPALKDGNISLINWNKLCDFVKNTHSDFADKLQSKGITQITVLGQHENPEHNMGNGWKNCFRVANKEEAQKAFKQQGYNFEWLNNENNECKLKKVRKSSELYSILTQLLSFFKTCQQRKLNLDELITFGNDQKIPVDILQSICQKCENFVSEVELKQNDLLIIDFSNIKYMHNPFEGPEELRKMYVSFMNFSKEVSQRKDKRLFQILNTGYKMPLIGFGTWKIKNEQAEEVVYNAIKNGYRLIDCASVYGNEVEVGRGIKKAIDEKIVKREDLFITSKLWNTNHRAQHVRPACQRTLKELGLKYLDLYLMHFPVSLKYVPPQQNKYTEWIYDPKSQTKYMLEEKVPVTQTWKAMEDLVQAKLVRNIGVSNFTVALLRQLIQTCQIKPMVLQTEIHPEMNEEKLIRYAREEGIQLTSYSSFGASSYVQIGFANQDEPIYKNDTIKEIAIKYEKSPHQIILRWAIQLGLAIIPKSTKQERMRQNASITQFVLEQQDMDKIWKLNKNRRYNDPGVFCQEFCGTFYPLHE